MSEEVDDGNQPPLINSPQSPKFRQDMKRAQKTEEDVHTLQAMVSYVSPIGSSAVEPVRFR